MANEHRRSIPFARKGVARVAVVLLLAAAADFRTSAASFAGDWPQFLGKNRDGVAHDEKPVAPWKESLAPQWKITLGAGYAGPVVAAGKVVVAHRQGANDHLDCYPAKGGERIWRASFPATYAGGYNPDKGPRAAPIVDGDQVFLFTATSQLHCVNFKTGKATWSRDLAKDYKLKESYFGAGASPLAIDSALIVALGGSPGAGVVAIDKANGKTLWKAVDDDVSYSSPILAARGGKPIIIAALREKCVGLNPKNGKVDFEVMFGDRGLSVTGATPVIEKDKLFLTAEYRIGAAMLDMSQADLPAVWENDESLSCHYSTPIFYQGHLYATAGREDYRQGDLRCVDAADGKVIWEEKGIGVAHAIRVGEQILLVGIDGELRLFKASPEKFEIQAKASLGAGEHRPAPAYADGRLLVRANQSPTTSELRCFRLSQ